MSTESIVLDRQTINAIAEQAAIRTVELLKGPSYDSHARARPAASSIWKPPLVDAAVVARALGVDLKTIYRHADGLGAVRVGRRLRFDLNRALRSWPFDEDDRCHSEKSRPPRSPVDKRSSSARQGTPDDTHRRLLPVGRGNRSE